MLLKCLRLCSRSKVRSLIKRVLILQFFGHHLLGLSPLSQFPVREIGVEIFLLKVACSYIVARPWRVGSLLVGYIVAHRVNHIHYTFLKSFFLLSFLSWHHLIFISLVSLLWYSSLKQISSEKTSPSSFSTRGVCFIFQIVDPFKRKFSGFYIAKGYSILLQLS